MSEVTTVVIQIPEKPVTFITESLPPGSSFVYTGVDPIEVNNTSKTIGFKSFTFVQPAALATWVITHNLNKLYPHVIVKDNSNETVIGNITALDVNNLRIDFLTATIGTAYLNGG